MNEASSDLSAALEEIHRLDTELSTSGDRQSEPVSLASGEDSAEVSQSETPSELPLIPNDDIAKFCRDFNKRVGVSTNTLDEVLEIIEIILSENCAQDMKATDNEIILRLRERNKTLKAKHSALKNEFMKVTRESDTTRAELDNTKYENHRLREELANTQQRLLTCEHDLKDMTERLNRETKSRELLEANSKDLGDLIKGQMDDALELTEQRDHLIELVNKQNQAMLSFEEELRALSKENDELKRKASEVVPVPQFESDIPVALVAFCHSAVEELPRLEKDLMTAKDDSSLDPIDRVRKVAKVLCREILKVGAEKDNCTTQNEALSEELKETKKKCLSILALFEEEIQFVQKLAHSNELQNCIFFRPQSASTLVLDEEAKDEWIRQCARMSKYVEETIPTLDIDQVNDAFAEFQQISSTDVFDFMKSDGLEQKIKCVLDRIDVDSIDTRALFSLFAAQALMNDLLQNHSVELRMRCELAQRDAGQVKQDVSGIEDSLKCAKKLLKRFQRREEKAKLMLARSFGVSGDADFASVLKEVVSFGGARRGDSITENDELLDELRKQLTETEKDLKTAEEMFSRKAEEYEATIKDLEAALVTEKDAKAEIEQKLQDAQKDFQETIDEYRARDEEQKREFAEFKESAENITKEQQRQICEAKENMDMARDELEKATAKITELRRDKKDAKERIAYLEGVQMKSVESLKAKSEALRKEYEKSLEDSRRQMEDLRESLELSQNERRDLQRKTEQLAAELRNTVIEKNSLELKITTTTEKFERERRTATAQLNAKIETAQQQVTDKLNSLVKHQQSVLEEFVRFAQEECACDLDCAGELSFDRFMAALRRYMEDSKDRERVYEETGIDVMRVKQILNLSPSDEMNKKVSSLIAERNRLLEEVKESDKALDKQEQQCQQLMQTLSKFEGDVASLHQWELWARRLHRVVYESASSTYSSEQLRLSLEEALLASVSHRTIVSRLECLREQKKAFMKVGNQALVSKSEVKPGIRPLICVCMAALRLQRISGCVRADNIGAQPAKNTRTAKHKKHLTPDVHRSSKAGIFRLY